jgi:flagellar biosynthesis anti-sigma factor FlgM
MDVQIARVGQVTQEYHKNRTVAVKNERVKGLSDSVAISSAAVDYQAARKALDSVADIRDERVREAINNIANGTFETNAEAIVEKLFSKMGITG